MRLQNTPSFTEFLALVITMALTDCAIVWNEPELWNKGLPSSIKAFQTSTSFVPGVPMTASYCKFSLKDPTLALKAVHTEVNLKTPLQYIEEEPAKVYMAVNAGYFDMITNLSISLIIEDGKVIDTNEPNITGAFGAQGGKATYYPTVSAFGVYPNGSAEIAWVYDIGNNADHNMYSYPTPAPNCFNCTPDPVPNATFPSGGQPWPVKEAVGAGPVLIKDGQILITTDSEKIKEIVKPELETERNPRTAICLTDNQEVIVLVVDGRCPGSGGLFLGELANLLLELGCKDAMNFDGGGSTALVVNGYTTNRPSDITGMRPVTSALLLVKANSSETIAQ